MSTTKAQSAWQRRLFWLVVSLVGLFILYWVLVTIASLTLKG